MLRVAFLLCALLASTAASGLSAPTISLWDPPSRLVATTAKAVPQPSAGFQPQPNQFKLSSMRITAMAPGRQVAVASTAGFLGISAVLGCIPQATAGLMTALIVTAPVNILDIAIMENASGKRAMIPALHAGFERLKTAPADFAKSPESALVYTLFAWTFATANICKAVKLPTAMALGVTTAANMGSCFYKDSELARMCGTTDKKSFPLLGYAALAGRDLLAMASAFTIPPVLSQTFVKAGMSGGLAQNLAQVMCPVVGQTVQVPFHLTALSLYNKPDLNFGQRLKLVREQYASTLYVRMARALPVFGAGGVLNTGLQGRLVQIAGSLGLAKA